MSRSDELRDIIRKHRSDPGDVERINSVFDDATGLDALMAQEPEDDPDDVHFREGNLLLCFSLRRGRNRTVADDRRSRVISDYDSPVRLRTAPRATIRHYRRRCRLSFV